MEDYAGRILADRYRLPLPPSDEYELVETRAFDTRADLDAVHRGHHGRRCGDEGFQAVPAAPVDQGR
ncbi:hypothetical protein ACWDA9_28380, partial [Streptomyces sp. NPDC001193]